MVGYEDLNLPIKDVLSTKQIQMKQSVMELLAVTINARKMVERKLGISKSFALVHFTDASTNQNDIFEIAQLVKLDTSLSKLTSVNLYINKARKDSGTFRINLYEYNDTIPGKRKVEKSIVQTKEIVPGWLNFDLTSHDIYIRGNTVIALEFIPSNSNENEPIVYEISLLGNGKAFTRANSLGKWISPPHKYRMFVTILSSE